MSKPDSGYFTETKGHIAEVAASLPKDPDDLLDNGWKETTDPRAKEASNSRVFTEEGTGLEIRFDKGIPGENGFKGKDHYHIMNPNAQGNLDLYLDKEGTPCARGSKKSHIMPSQGN